MCVCVCVELTVNCTSMYNKVYDPATGCLSDIQWILYSIFPVYNIECHNSVYADWSWEYITQREMWNKHASVNHCLTYISLVWLDYFQIICFIGGDKSCMPICKYGVYRLEIKYCAYCLFWFYIYTSASLFTS